MFCADKGESVPYWSAKHKMKTFEFFANHPVFSLDEAAKALVPPGGRSGTVERLKHYREKGQLMLVTRGIYALVPAGMNSNQFRPDPFLVAAAVRPDCIFSHHSALELLGAAHSVWNRYSVYAAKRRKPLSLEGASIFFMEHPAQMRSESNKGFATQRVERRGKMLLVTSPERTLVEGFRRPALAGGLEELVQSAGGFPTLDLDLLKEILQRYDIALLWAATGWFLERFQKVFHVSDDYLGKIERLRPCSPQYLERNLRGGWQNSRWNLILPDVLKQLKENDAN
jgi:predicted transcriptional regulator of viral defense system